jgi:hypothetical protein
LVLLLPQATQHVFVFNERFPSCHSQIVRTLKPSVPLYTSLGQGLQMIPLTFFHFCSTSILQLSSQPSLFHIKYSHPFLSMGVG